MAVAPLLRLSLVLMVLPVPDPSAAVGKLPPPTIAAVQVIPVKLVGILSTKDMPFKSQSPLFLTVIV
ncbi:MAG: hypothetical protein HC789_09355 [Microcoleus sp. CSU_2_2]|nr:hypothetical protein [Microcoleus sp. SU_5_3]NJS10565.1 hypothetical protein [Microcoleus sp. CSU_2_2]